MTIDYAKELIEDQAKMASGFNRNAARLILAEVEKEHGQSAVDGLIREFNLEKAFGFIAGKSLVLKV